MNNKTDEYGNKWMKHLQIMPETRIPKEVTKYVPRRRRCLGTSKKKNRWNAQSIRSVTGMEKEEDERKKKK